MKAWNPHRMTETLRPFVHPYRLSHWDPFIVSVKMHTEGCLIGIARTDRKRDIEEVLGPRCEVRTPEYRGSRVHVDDENSCCSRTTLTNGMNRHPCLHPRFELWESLSLSTSSSCMTICRNFDGGLVSKGSKIC